MLVNLQRTREEMRQLVDIVALLQTADPDLQGIGVGGFPASLNQTIETDLFFVELDTKSSVRYVKEDILIPIDYRLGGRAARRGRAGSTLMSLPPNLELFSAATAAAAWSAVS